MTILNLNQGQKHNDRIPQHVEDWLENGFFTFLLCVHVKFHIFSLSFIWTSQSRARFANILKKTKCNSATGTHPNQSMLGDFMSLCHKGLELLAPLFILVLDFLVPFGLGLPDKPGNAVLIDEIDDSEEDRGVAKPSLHARETKVQCKMWN